MIITQQQLEILNGHLLGDGRLHKVSLNASFQLIRQYKDLEYLTWSFNHFKDFINYSAPKKVSVYDNRTQKTYYSARMQTLTNPVFTEFHTKWYAGGKKIVPLDIELTPLTTAVWFADDGNVVRRWKNSLEASIATNSFTLDEVEMLVDKMIAFVDKVSISKVRNKDQYIIRLSGDSPRYLFRYIDEVFPPLERKSIIWKGDLVNRYDRVGFPNCYKCNSSNVRSSGFIHKFNKRQYRCVECGQRFFDIDTYKTKPQFLTQSQWYSVNPLADLTANKNCKICGLEYLKDRNAFYLIKNVNSDTEYIPNICKFCGYKNWRRNHPKSERKIKTLEFDGEVLSLQEWSKKLGFGKNVISSRLHRGWTVEKALTTPQR